MSDASPEDGYISVIGAAALLGMTRQGVYLRIRKGTLPARFKLRGRRLVYLVRRADVDAIIARGDVGDEHKSRRQMSAFRRRRNNRRAMVKTLWTSGLSVPEIAGKLQWSVSLIKSDLRALNCDISARKRQLRRAAVDELRREGLSMRLIANELGISEFTVVADLRKLGYPKGERKHKRDRRENDI